MKIEVLTTAKTVETVNYILGQAIDELMQRPQIAKQMDLSAKDVIGAEQFRPRLLKSYFKQSKNTKK